MTPGGTLDLPVVRAALRAAPRGPLARRRAAADRAGAAAARRGPRAGGGRLMAGPRPALVAGLRRFVREPPRAQPPPAGRATAAAASCARSRWPTTTSTCSTSRSGGSSACARPAGRCARARRATGRPGSRTLWLERPRAVRRAVGGVPDPDRPRVLPALDRAPARSSACTRARRGRPSASSTSTPGTGSSPRTPCSRTSIPTPRR